MTQWWSTKSKMNRLSDCVDQACPVIEPKLFSNPSLAAT